MPLALHLKISRHGVYYFRVVIPVSIRPTFGSRCEIKKSLSARDHASPNDSPIIFPLLYVISHTPSLSSKNKVLRRSIEPAAHLIQTALKLLTVPPSFPVRDFRTSHIAQADGQKPTSSH